MSSGGLHPLAVQSLHLWETLHDRSRDLQRQRIAILFSAACSFSSLQRLNSLSPGCAPDSESDCPLCCSTIQILPVGTPKHTKNLSGT